MPFLYLDKLPSWQTFATDDLSHASFPLPATRGMPLTSDEKVVHLSMAREGLERLSRMKPGGGGHTAGCEAELVAIDGDGCPLAIGPQVVSEMHSMSRSHEGVFPVSVDREHAQFNLELNLHKTDLGPDFLRSLEFQLVGKLNMLSNSARSFGGRLASVGVLPSICREHLAGDWMTPRVRYADLEASLAEYTELHPREIDFARSNVQGDFRVNLDRSGLRFKAPGCDVFLDTSLGYMFRYQALDTSLQLHWGVANEADYVRDHRIAELISPIMVGAFACSPFVLGEPTGMKESRLFVYTSMLHPRRVILSTDWIEHPLGQLEASLGRGVVLGQRGSKVADQPLNPLLALDLLHGTVWPLNRTKWTANEGTGTRMLRIEHRPIPALPTILDTMSATALFYGLMLGMPEYLEVRGIDLGQATTANELNRTLPYFDHDANVPSLVRNIGYACIEGLNATIRWIDGQDFTVHALLQTELLEVARVGLAKMGVPKNHVESYLGPIERRLNGELGGQVGVTPADVMQAWYGSRKLQGLNSRQRCNQISLRLADMLTEDSRGIWDIHLDKYQ